ncbi:class I SAM-dependent methyltransferase [Campylobacter sp. FMV-PI01]|uniref:Class I SAM-dependent methyltransferase n=1 Tax=Campylobacter portucalensis TaxID=2608384 RepID=A0A6L5WIE2_9BACT|nr:class I SAM-dependent methyltransferase [Campylobacter portucalensis]MSN96814.1 class I SAM-dependent methyltransferase [Campylobacter portucalensis]
MQTSKNKEKISFNNTVSETLLINLYFRAKENELKNPILKDEFSGEVVKKIDYDFSKFDKSKLSRVGTIIRAKFFDDELLKLNNENLVIVQVGAGLDTRPLRLENSFKNAYFYDLDLPDVINLRDNLIPKAKNNFYLSTSMLETAWMDELKSKHENAKFIFILEGVSMYFCQDDLKEFFINLASRFNGLIMADFMNKFAAYKFDNKHHDAMKHIKNAKFKFGIDDESEILAWDERIQFVKKGVMFDMHRKRWGLLGNIVRLFKRVRYSCVMYVFKIN